MKEIPPLAGWPMQVSLVREPKPTAEKKRKRLSHLRKRPRYKGKSNI